MSLVLFVGLCRFCLVNKSLLLLLLLLLLFLPQIPEAKKQREGSGVLTLTQIKGRK